MADGIKSDYKQLVLAKIRLFARGLKLINSILNVFDLPAFLMGVSLRAGPSLLAFFSCEKATKKALKQAVQSLTHSSMIKKLIKKP